MRKLTFFTLIGLIFIFFVTPISALSNYIAVNGNPSEIQEVNSGTVIITSQYATNGEAFAATCVGNSTTPVNVSYAWYKASANAYWEGNTGFFNGSATLPSATSAPISWDTDIGDIIYGGIEERVTCKNAGSTINTIYRLRIIPLSNRLLNYTPPTTDPPVCDFEISPYPADPGTLLTLTDLSTGDPDGYGWMVLPPIGPWDNESLGIASDAYYTLGQFGQYTFAHEVHNAGGTVQCSYDYWSGTNYTAFNVTPTLVGNLTTNITATNISGQFAPLNLTLIDKPFFKNQLDNMTYFGNYSSAWTGFIDNMTESVNVTFNEVEARINPFNFLTDIIMNSHNLFVVIFIPLLGYVSFPLAITSAVINIIPQPIQLLISLGLLVDLFFLVLRGPD